MPKTVDIIGNKYGLLTVIEKTTERKNGHVVWKCQCDCGNQVTVKGILLSSGGVKSCGCLKSIGESKITHYLQHNDILFEKQKSFETCRFSDTNSLAKFDFYLPKQNILIEYDGEQHFTCRGNGWNTQEHLEKTQERDAYKNHWAKNNNITLVRIKYTEVENIENILNDLLQREEAH